MEMFTHYHQLGIRDIDTLDLLQFKGKLQFEMGDDTYCHIAAKTVKDYGASENYVRTNTPERIRKKGVELEERDGGWMIVETANDRVENGIQRWHQVHLKLRLGDDGDSYTGWFTMSDLRGYDIVLGEGWVRDNNGMRSIDNRKTEMWIMLGRLPWDDWEKAAEIHYLCGLRRDDELAEDLVWQAAHTMGIEIVNEKQLCHTSHCLLAKASMVCVRYDAEESPEHKALPKQVREQLLALGPVACWTNHRTK